MDAYEKPMNLALQVHPTAGGATWEMILAVIGRPVKEMAQVKEKD